MSELMDLFVAASAYRIRRFVREHALADRPHTSLWLAKTYVIPAGMHVW